MSFYPQRPFAYVRLAAQSTAPYQRICQDLLGCESVAAGPDCIVLRCDDRARSIVVATSETQDTDARRAVA
jgi:hypothetical protein